MPREPYFKSESEVKKLFETAFSALNEEGYSKRVAALFDEAFLHDPYVPEVHYALARYFAKRNDEGKSLWQFTIAYDLDSDYYERALHDQDFIKNIPEKMFAPVRGNQISRMWNVISFRQVEPVYNHGDIKLYFKSDHRSDYKNSIATIYHDLDDQTEHYFRPIPDSLDWFEKATHFLLEGDSDRHYSIYGQLIMALKSFAPFVEDVHFFIESESYKRIDEAKIENGMFYFYRHVLKNEYHDQQLLLFRKLSDADPKNTPLAHFVSLEYSKWALYFIRDNSVQRGKKYLDTALRYWPHNIEIPYILSEFYKKKNNLKKQKEYLLRAVAVSPHNTEAFFKLANLAFARKEYDQAEGYFSRSLEENDAYTIDALAYIYRAICREFLGRKEQADVDLKTYIEKVTGGYGQMLALAGQYAFDTHSGFALPLFEAAVASGLAHIKNLDERERQNSASPENKAFYNRERQTTRIHIANAYNGIAMCTDDIPEKAMQALKKALEFNPDSEDYLYNIGRQYQKAGNNNEALAYYEKALVLSPNYEKALNNKTIIYINQRDPKNTLQTAKKFYKIDPSNPDASLGMGSAYIFAKKYKQALKYYKKALELDSKSDKGYYGVGLAYHWLKKYTEAIPMYEKCLKILPGQIPTMTNLASCYCEVGKIDEADKLADAAIAADPKYYHGYYVKASVYSKRGAPEQVFEMLRKTVALDPTQKKNIRKDSDYKSLRKTPEFKEIVRV